MICLKWVPFFICGKHFEFAHSPTTTTYFTLPEDQRLLKDSIVMKKILKIKKSSKQTFKQLNGGRYRIRTYDHLLVRQVLYQLS